MSKTTNVKSGSNQQTVALNIPHHQVTGFESKSYKHEVIYTPAQSVPSFGSYYIIDFKEKNIKVHSIMLNYNVSPISNLSNGPIANYPRFTPVDFWHTRIEIIINNNIIDTLYPTLNFIERNLYELDDYRKIDNYASGNYLDGTNRSSLASYNSNYYFNLKTFFNQNHMALLTSSHDVQLRVYMNTLTNIVEQSTLTGTPIATINSCQLITKVTRLSQSDVQSHLGQMMKIPMHLKYHSTSYQPFTIQAGTTQANLILSSIVGKVSVLYFVINPSGYNQSEYYNYTPLQQFAILDGASTNIVGGVDLLSNFNLLVQSKEWSKSSFLSESFAQLNNSYVYSYSFSVDPVKSYETGGDYTTRQFNGTEQLKLVFPSALGSTTQVDVYALLSSVVEQTHVSVQKLLL